MHRRYEDLLRGATDADIGGIAVRLAGLADIIASKEWANRPKDHQALPELRQIADQRAAERSTDDDDYDVG